MIALIAKRLDFFSLAWSGCLLWMAASARREELRTFVEASTSQEFRDRPRMSVPSEPLPVQRGKLKHDVNGWGRSSLSLNERLTVEALWEHGA
jgi:hypothetical protein